MPPHVESILQYLSRAESGEIDPWMRDDLRIAWLTVLYSSRGLPQPFVLASYRVLGLHPDQLQAAIEARRRSKLGRMYVPADQWGDLALDLPPKKPSVSVSPKPAAERKRSSS